MGAILREISTERQWRLDEGESWTYGRASDCAIHLADPACARRHGRIEWREGTWLVVDHLTTNGTWLNGIRVEREELRDGDVLSIGQALFEFRSDGIPPRVRAGERESDLPRLPQSFAALLAVFTGDAAAVDGAVIVARAGNDLLRFCDDPSRVPLLKEAYQKGLSSPWPVVRAVSTQGIAALAASRLLETPEAGAAVGPLLGDPADYVRKNAARALARIDPLGAAPRLHARAIEAVETGASTREAGEAAAQLVDVGEASLLASLRERATALAIDARDLSIRARAIAALGEIAASGDAEAVRALRAILAEPSEELRVQAVRALARGIDASDDARFALRNALHDPSPRVFLEACRGFSTRPARDPSLAAALIETLRETARTDVQRRARIRRALEDVTGERRGPDPDAWL